MKRSVGAVFYNGILDVQEVEMPSLKENQVLELK